MFIAGCFLQCIRPDVMIRNAKAICGNKRATAAGIKTDAGLLEMFEPLRGGLEMILRLELLERRIVEQPHSFVSDCGDGSGNQNHNNDANDEAENHREL